MEHDIPLLTAQEVKETLSRLNTFLPLVLLSDPNTVHTYFIDWGNAPRIRVMHKTDGDFQKVQKRTDVFMRVLAPEIGMEINPTDPLRYSQTFSFDANAFSAHQRLKAHTQLLDYVRSANISQEDRTTLEAAL